MPLILNEADVKKMLLELGYPEERLASTKIITKLANRLSTVSNDLGVPDSRESALLRDRVLAANDSGEEIVMSSESGNGTTTAVAEAPAKKKKTKADKPAVERDQYGMHPDKPTGRINAVLSKKHKSPETIAEESGQPLGRVKGHLNYWLKHPDTKLGSILAKDEDGRWYLNKP